MAEGVEYPTDDHITADSPAEEETPAEEEGAPAAKGGTTDAPAETTDTPPAEGTVPG